MLSRAVPVALVVALAVAAPAAARSKPVAALSGPATVRLGFKATFDASSSKADPAGKIVEYAWDLDADGTFEEVRRGARITIEPEVLGEQVIAVRITDDAGDTSAAVGHYLVEGDPVAPAEPDPEPDPSTPETTAEALGGDAARGVAPLDSIAQQWIRPGSARRFAAINGEARRRLGAVRRHGLWLNLLADRSARFRLDVTVTRAAARRLSLRGPAAAGRVRLARVTTRLPVAGQRAFRVALPRAVRRALRGPVTLLVRGWATDAHGRRAAVSRAFALRR